MNVTRTEHFGFRLLKRPTTLSVLSSGDGSAPLVSIYSRRSFPSIIPRLVAGLQAGFNQSTKGHDLLFYPIPPSDHQPV